MRDFEKCGPFIAKSSNASSPSTPKRAREEAASHIRWLRPDYQIPLFTRTPNRNLNPTPNLLGATSTASPELNLAPHEPKSRKPKPTKKSAFRIPHSAFRIPHSAIRIPQSAIPKLPWPSSLPDRTKAILALIQDRGTTPFTAEEIARRFNRAQTVQVTEVLETLCAVGKARKGKQSGTYTH